MFFNLTCDILHWLVFLDDTCEIMKWVVFLDVTCDIMKWLVFLDITCDIMKWLVFLDVTCDIMKWLVPFACSTNSSCLWGWVGVGGVKVCVIVILSSSERIERFYTMTFDYYRENIRH